VSDRKQPDERVWRYLQWYSLRLRAEPEDRILRELRGLGLGEFGSLDTLYRRLANDGFPVCRVCGRTPVSPEHCQVPNTKRKRKARRTGERVELPSASAATGIFRAALVALGDDVSKLAERREWLQGERFVAGDYQTGRVVLRTWGGDPLVDPPIETVLQEDGDIAIPQGAGRAPAEPLTTLIGVAVLAGYPITPLLRALHPDPSTIRAERLEQAVQETKDKVRQLARLVRGGGIRRGPSTEEVSPLEQLAAWEIHGLMQAGATEREVQEYLSGMGFGSEAISRLRSLRLDPDIRWQS
jgi:hypothetical protein